ncbi:MAG: hypothetical protein K9M57_10700, partial [Phycisphaerae bacterium]|nr:hypothetical protein [Phycisphaerae bacterium]
MKAKRSVCSVLLVTLMSFLFCGSVATTAENPADWAPADALFFVQMNDINLLRDKIKKTNSWGMYTEEAMQPFIRQIMEEVDKKLAEGMKDFWKEIGLSEAPEQIPWPQGKIVAIGFVQPRMMKVADDQEMAAPDFQVVGLVDLGDNIDIARKISLNITQKAAEEG